MASSKVQPVKVQKSKSQSHKYSPSVDMATASLCQWPKCAPKDASMVTSHTPRGRWLMVAKDGSMLKVCSIHYKVALKSGHKVASEQARAILSAVKADKAKSQQASPLTQEALAKRMAPHPQPEGAEAHRASLRASLVARVASQPKSQPVVATVVAKSQPE